MKKLDKLIIKAFIGPFVATFFITLFVLVMQFFWLWIDDFVGKGLDAFTILRFIWYQSAVLIPLALPLAVLLSSLMTFGNLGESFELVAIKSSGISLLRFMRPLVVVTLFISFCAFLFANYVIPVAQLKSRTMLADIVLAKPAFDIKEGIFYDKLDRFAIKIGKKEKDDSTIRDLIVFENNYGSLQDNFIVAKNGVMKPSPDKRFLDIVFRDGWRYQERGNRTDSATEYIRLGFKEYKMQLDISAFNFKASNDSSNRNNERVLSMRQLDKALDSMTKYTNVEVERYQANLLNNFSLLLYKDSVTKGISIPDSILNFKKNKDAFLGLDTITGRAKATLLPIKTDTVSKKKETVKAPEKKRRKSRKSRNTRRPVFAIDTILQKMAEVKADSLKKMVRDSGSAKKDTVKKAGGDSAALQKDSTRKDTARKQVKPVKKNANIFTAFLPDSAQSNVSERALGTISVVKDNASMNLSSIQEQEKNIRRYKIEWHKKIVLALACFLMFMIGAPLGSIIRKGGLGTPMIFAIAFFLVFYFSSNTGEKMAKEGSLTPFSGMWLSTFVLAPIGAFLTYKAMHDSNLFNKEFYHRLKRRIQKYIKAKRMRHSENRKTV
ncbi:LptF/LptG family permease [Niabella drilacis]|uniref:Lipopolysaccharide export system permease protein n=1 Tax=Niabella drilacis (strain DSM 25811 / CCM 8410 / CCUG 62505 / LMG 26954 / E90) TaxID=1285928 RepID=A0A1G6QC32_NIADE|nr:LptF/LptG family permease [Niabella drilacis]SDC90050.1 lipopolysaccharide export system permease protein [Niabella drilacis]